MQVPHHEGLVTRRNFEKIAENFMKMKEFWDFWEFQDATPPPSPVPPVEKKHYRVYRVYNVWMYEWVLFVCESVNL